MFESINPFGLKSFKTLMAQSRSGEVALSPPAVYLPLALLRRVASGATRTGLSRALESNEALSDEEREHRVRTLRGILNGEGYISETSFKVRSHRPFSPTFLQRTHETYGISVHADDSNLPLRLVTQVTMQLKLKEEVSCVQVERLTGLCFSDTEGHRKLYLLIPCRAGLFQNKQKPLQHLLERLDDAFLVGWQERLAAAEPQIPGALALPSLPTAVDSRDLMGVLKALDLGPALTPAADFSRMMVSGEAPYLSTLRHTFQLQATGIETNSEPAPLLWWVTDSATGLRLAMGARRSTD